MGDVCAGVCVCVLRGVLCDYLLVTGAYGTKAQGSVGGRAGSSTCVLTGFTHVHIYIKNSNTCNTQTDMKNIHN